MFFIIKFVFNNNFDTYLKLFKNIFHRTLGLYVKYMIYLSFSKLTFSNCLILHCVCQISYSVLPFLLNDSIVSLFVCLPVDTAICRMSGAVFASPLEAEWRAQHAALRYSDNAYPSCSGTLLPSFVVVLLL